MASRTDKKKEDLVHQKVGSAVNLLDSLIFIVPVNMNIFKCHIFRLLSRTDFLKTRAKATPQELSIIHDFFSSPS